MVAPCEDYNSDDKYIQEQNYAFIRHLNFPFPIKNSQNKFLSEYRQIARLI
jgi:hypothetical protein